MKKFSFFFLFFLIVLNTSAQEIYFGGEGYGYAFKENIQTVCTPLAIESIFLGGYGNGYAFKENIQTVCTPLAIESIFFGGYGNGYAFKENIQTVCTPLTIESIFLGGYGNGYAFKENIQTVCTPLAIESIFLGGNGSGSAMKQGDCNDDTVIVRVTALESDGTYGQGDVLNLIVEFNSSVSVTGNPTLHLETGSSDGIAYYSSGSGTASLTFQYTVLFGHVSSQLSYQGSNTLLLNGGSIKDSENKGAVVVVPETGSSNSLSAQKTLIIDTNQAPTILQTQIALDNSSVSVSFSESVFNTNSGSGNLQANDFTLTLSGGNATLSSTTPSSISIDGTTITLGLALTGTPNGKELLTISPVVNSIYDGEGKVASTTQNKNTAHLIPDIVTTNLVLYLDAANHSSYAGSGNNWYDLSGNNNHGVINGATFSTNGGGSMSFDGINDLVTIPDDNTLDFTNEFTLTYLLEKTSTEINSPYINKGGSSRNYSTWIGYDGGIDIDNGSSGSDFRPLYNVVSTGPGEWIEITITINNNTIKTYVNGTLKNSRNGSLGSTNGSSLTIGYLSFWGYYGKGKLKNILLYNQALDADQVWSNFNGLTTAPIISNSSLAADNTTVSVTFDQAVFDTNSGNGAIETGDFNLSISGGSATLSSATPSSITVNGNIIELGISLIGSADGNETLTISPAPNAIFNTNGFSASTTQNNTTVLLNAFINGTPTDIALSSSTVEENVPIATTVGGFTSTDVDAGETFTYILVDGEGASDNASFSISGANLLTAAALDFETKSSYSIRVQTSDGTASYEKSFSITVTDVNEAPTDIALSSSSVEENVPTGTTVGGLSTTDADSGDSFTYALVDGDGATDNASFSINGVSESSYALDFDGSNDLVTTSIDADRNAMPSTTWSGWIKPTGISGWQVIFGMEDGGWDRFLIIESGSLQLSLGHTTGRWQTGVYVSPGNWQHVAVVYDNGSMRFYYNGTEYSTGTNEGDHSSNGKFTIGANQNTATGNHYRGLIDEVAVWDEALTATEITALYNAGAGLNAKVDGGNYLSSSNLVGYFKMNEGSGNTLIDASGNGNTATLENMDASSDWVTGDISPTSQNQGNGYNLITAAALDFETKSSYSIRVQTSDGTASYEKSLTINVNDVNEAPTDIALSSSSVEENVSTGTTVGGFTSTDVDAGDTFTYTLVDGDGASDNASFSISGTNLLTAAALDFENKSSYSIRVQTSDGTASYEKSFSITVNDVNEAPTDISFVDDGFSDNGLILHLDSGNSSSYPGAGNTWYDLSDNNFNAVLMNSPSYSNTAGGLIDLNGSSHWIQVDSFAGALTNNTAYTISIWFKSTETNPSGNIYHNAIFSMHTTSGSNRYRIGAAPDANRGLYYNFGTNSSEGRVTQLNLHDNQWHNLTITKNTGVEAQFYIDDILRTSNGSITNGVDFNSVGKVSIGQEYDGNNETDHFQGNIPVVMVYNRALNQDDRTSLYNYYENRYINGNLNSGTTTNSTNIDEEVPIGTVVAPLFASDSETSSLTFSLVSGNGTNDQHNSLFTISGNQIIVNGLIDFETNAVLNVHVQVTDGEFTYAKALTINVNDINEAPTDIALSSSSVEENVSTGTTVGGFTSTDVDAGDTFTYTLVDGDGASDNASFSISGANLLTAAALDFETKSSYSIRVQSSDGTASYEKSFSISISDSQTPTVSSNTVSKSYTVTVSSDFLNGNIVWQESTDGTNWVNVSSGTSVETSLSTNSISYSFTGSVQYWPVPAGVTNIDVDGFGAAGKSSSSSSNSNLTSSGGKGGRVQATLITTPGEVLEIYVGGRNGFNGGGQAVDNSGSGGGATDIRQQGSSLADRIYVAGGGGGGARHRSSYRGGNGGAGGGLIGAQGGNGVYQGGGGNGGSGGSQSQGGNINGVLGAGGDGYYNQGNNQYTSSGSGGGGYYGGGRGHAKRYKTSGGGGGGSSYTNNSATNVIHTQGYINATENGGLTITSILNPQRILSTYTSSALFNDVLFRAVINGVTTPAVSITVLNSTPTDISLSSSSVEENVSTGTTVGGFTSTDVDAGDTFTYTLVDGDGATDNANFSISGANLLTAAALDFENKSSYSIRVQTSDGTASYEKSFSITVNDVNDAPTDIRFITNTAAVKTTDLILYLDAANPNSYSGSGTTWNDLSGNGNDFTIYGATHNTAGYFDFDGTDDWARSLSTLDLTAYESISVQVYLKSENTNQIEISYEHSANWNSNTGGFGLAIHCNGGPFTLNEHHTNHNAGIGPRNYQATVGSNWHTNTNIFSVKADASGRLTYVNGLLTPLNGSTTTQNGTFLNDYFYLASREGSSLFFNGQVKTLLIYGSKLSQEEVSNNFDIITNTSSSSLVSSNAITVDENTALNTLITGLAVTDEDLNDTHSFSLVNGVGEIGRDNDSVTVSGSQLLVNAAIDYESTPYLLLNIQVSDGSSSYTSSFTITVNDINEGVPSDISLSNTAFFEDIALGNAIASLTVVDPDTSATHTYTLIDSGDAQDDDNNHFSVNGTTLVSSGTFDFETKNSYNIYLSVTDGETSYEEAFTLRVSDTNEAPTDIIVSTGSSVNHVSENLLLYLDARNEDSYSGSGSTWNDLSGNNLDFTINGSMSHDSTNGFKFDTGQTSKYMISNAFPHPTTTFSDEYYIKTTRTTQSTWKSYSVNGNANESIMLFHQRANNISIFTVGNEFYTDVSLADGNWHHLVRTSNRATGKEIIYLDGIEVYQGTQFAGNLIDTSGFYVIGQEQDSFGGGFDGNQAFDGYLPVVRMYNSVLSAEEVAQNYASITNASSISTSTSDLLVEENAAIGTLIASLDVVDQDANNIHTFSMVDGLGDIGRDNGSVTVSGTQLVVNGAVDYEASPFLLVNVGVNDGVNTFTSSFTIFITDVSAPTDIDLSNTAFPEDSLAGTAIATLTAVNIDANFTNHIFSLAPSSGTLDEDNASFTVSGTSLVTSGTFDFETKNSYNIYLKVTDGVADYYEAFTLTVSDTNEPPTGINFAYPFVDENVPLGTSVFGLTSSSQSGEGFVNYKSYKTHNGNGSNSTFGGYTYSGLADSITELEAMLDTNYSGTTLTHSGETEANSSGGFIDGRPPHWGSSYYAVLHYGWFQAQETGTYTFEITSDDGSALWIDGVPIIFRPCCGTSTVEVSLTSGQWYYFETKWQEYTGGDYMRLRYRTPSSSSYKYVGADPNTLKVTNVEPIFDVLTTIDPDTGNIHTYSLVAGEGDDDNGSFTVSGTSLVTAAELDYETKNSYTVRLETFDGVNSFSDAFVISIQDVNDNAPTAMALSTSTLNEDALSGTLVAEISTTDTDTNDVNEFTYSLVAGDGTNDGDNGSFIVNGTSLITSGTYDFEPMSDPNLYIVVEVNDGSFTYSQTFVIGVNDRDDSPTDIALDNTAIFENIPLATAIASLTTVDQNPGDTHTYSLVATNSTEDDDNGSFTVSGTQLLTNAEFDFETKNTYNIYLQVSDGTGTRDYYEAFTITVSDTNEAPTEIDFAGGPGSSSSGGSTSATGLIVHLDASNAASTATPNSRWIDLSGNGNHGDILTGVSFQNKTFKTTNAGGRSGIRVGPLPTILNAGYSFTIVVKVTPQSTSGNILGLSSDSQHGGWNAPVIPTANSKVFPGLHSAHGQFQRPYDIGTTYEYVYSFNHTNNEHKFYENGDLVNTRTVGFAAANTPGYLFLGDDNPGCCGNYEGVHSADFVGDFHRFMVYNQALTDQQIAGLYQSASFDENAPIGSAVGDLYNIDQDTNNSYTYTLVNGDGSNDINNTSFTVSGTQLIVNELFDYESVQELYINVQVNDGLNTLTDSVTIQINDVNDNAPTAMALSTNTFNEDILSATLISVISSTDADSDAVNNFTYSLVAGDGTNDQHNNRFTISGNSLISSGTFDFEAVVDPTIYLNLEVNDGLFTYTQAVTLSLLNTNDAPTDIALSNTTIYENIPLATAIASLTTEDQNTGDIHTFSFTATNSNEDDDNGSFTVSGTQLLTNDSFDFETKNSYNIYLKVSDGTGTTDYYKAFTITVSNVNEAPTSINIMPDGVSLDGLVVHLDAGNTRSYPGTGNTWYDLSGNGNHFNKNTATFINSSFGYMNYNGSYSHSINSISSTFEDGYTAIILMKYNSFSGGSFHYNDSSSYINFHNGGRNRLRWETNGGNAIYSQNTLNTNEWYLFAGTHEGITSMNQSGSAKIYINGTLDQDVNLTANPSTNAVMKLGEYGGALNGSISAFLFYNRELSADEITEVTDFYSNRVNGIGSSSSSGDGTVEENASIGTLISELTVSDEDTNNTHLFSLVDGAGDIGRDNASVTVSGTQLLVNGTIDYESTPYLLVNIQVNDGTNSLTSSFTINVTDLNDTAPTAIGLSTTTFTEHIASGTIVASLSATDVDTPNLNNYSFDLVGGDGTNDASNARFTVSGISLISSGTFDFETAASHNVYLQVNDGANTFNQAFTLTVGNQNDVPTDISLSQTVLDENTPIASLVANLSVADQDILDSHVFTLENSGDVQDDDNSSFTVSGTALLTNAAFDYETQTSYSIYLKVSDGVSDYSEAFSISISDVNEVPTSISLTTGSSSTLSNVVSINDDEALNTIIGNLQTTDEDPNDTFLYSLVSGNGTNDLDNGLFTISGNQLLLTTNLDYQRQPTANINILVSDGVNTFSKTFNFSIIDKTGPRLSAINIADDNGTFALQFDEDAFNTPTAAGSLTASDFILSSAGGTASLTSSIPSSITFNGTQYILGLPLQGAASGDEILTVDVVTNAVYDALGNVASGLQSNTFSLYGDADGDGVLDSVDICSDTPLGEIADLNGCAESQKDPDNDGISGSSDNCPNNYNPNQADNDNDGTGDLCDPDDDNDGILDSIDNCQSVFNPNQEDNDGDGIGDVCDLDNDNDGIDDVDEIALGLDPLGSDSDNDGVDDALDPFPLDETEWLDTDNDGIGNNTDTDIDGDGYINTFELECLSDPLEATSLPDDFDGDFNPDCLDEDDDNDGFLDTEDDLPFNQEEWIDSDGDGLGDNEDPDDDNDTFIDEEDAFPFDLYEWLDTDSDGLGNNADTDDDNDGYLDIDEIECESNPLSRRSLPSDFDGDYIPDCLDEDDDNDGYLDTEDDLPFNQEEWLDTDSDGLGNNADTDDDNDGYLDLDEIECESNPLSTRSRPSDFDGDYIPDCLDEDDDNDGVLDIEDDFPFNPYESVDTDGDGFGNNADWDSDNDGVPDSMDAFPNDPNESKDTDGDGIGDNTDLDKNNDGYPDELIFVSPVLTPKSIGVESTWQVINIEEYNYSVIKIFSPDGNIVFKVVNYKNDWRGAHYDTGETLPTGPYLYQIYLGKDVDPVSGWLYIFN